MLKVTGRIVGVQYLRGVAALMVVYYHAALVMPEFRHQLSLSAPFRHEGLAAGVHVFFVLSGFIMLATTTRTRPTDFLIKRAIRIVPLYWLLTALLAALIVVPPHLFRQTALNPAAFIKSLLFIGYVNQNGSISPLLAPGWTLNIEMFFYCVFAVALLLPLERRLPVVAAVLVPLVLLGSRLVSPQSSPELWQITRSWMLEFVIGMAIAQAWLRGKLLWRAAFCYGLILAGFVGLLTDWPRIFGGASDFIVPSGLIVLGTVALEQEHGIVARPWPLLLGDASYSIYLSHFVTLAAVKVLWERLGLTHGLMAACGFALVAMIASIFAALALHRFAEVPLLEGLQRRHRAAKERASIALPGDKGSLRV
jgi:exopolysaccharide production protein ExoZ